MQYILNSVQSQTKIGHRFYLVTKTITKVIILSNNEMVININVRVEILTSVYLDYLIVSEHVFDLFIIN